MFTSVGNGIRSAWNGICNGVKSVWNGACNVLRSVWNGFKSFFSSVGNGIKSAWQGVCNGIKSIFSPVINFIKNSWNSVKSAFSNAGSALTAPFRYLANSIGGIWHSIRSAIKLPHFKISGSFSLDPPSIPHIGVDWYWKGGIFNTPTVLGNVGVGDSFSGHGSNAEAIVPLDSMYKNIEEIVSRINKGNTKNITIENHIFLDGKEIAYSTAKYVDNKLGEIQAIKERGGC